MSASPSHRALRRSRHTGHLPRGRLAMSFIVPIRRDRHATVVGTVGFAIGQARRLEHCSRECWSAVSVRSARRFYVARRHGCVKIPANKGDSRLLELCYESNTWSKPSSRRRRRSCMRLPANSPPPSSADTSGLAGGRGAAGSVRRRPPDRPADVPARSNGPTAPGRSRSTGPPTTTQYVKQRLR